LVQIRGRAVSVGAFGDSDLAIDVCASVVADFDRGVTHVDVEGHAARAAAVGAFIVNGTGRLI
jgi:hypothetical protein